MLIQDLMSGYETLKPCELSNDNNQFNKYEPLICVSFSLHFAINHNKARVRKKF